MENSAELEGYLRHLRAIESVANMPLFFIVGVAKSGTTWLQKLLDGHPDICCKGESHIVNMLIPGIMDLLGQHNKVIHDKNTMLQQEEGGYPVFSDEEALYVAKTAMYTLLNAQLGNSTASIIGEKTPNHLHHMVQISEHLIPSARFIHIIRDGRDAAVSGWHHIYRNMPEWARENYPTLAGYVELFAQTWVNEIDVARQYARRFPGNYLEIKYEDLKANPEASMLPMLRFLKADDSSGSISQCIANGSFQRVSGGRVAGVEDSASHFRKGIVGDWRNTFDARCEDIFNRYAGKLLAELGYAQGKA